MSNAFKKSSSLVGSLCLAAVVTTSVGYFGYQSFSGQYGMEARSELDARRTTLRSELAVLQRQEARLERRVASLSDGQVDSDLLEEQARAVLHFAKPEDIVVR